MIDEHLASLGMARDVMVRSAHFSLIPLMVAQSLLVLTTGRLFCSRYVDALPVRIVRCPVPFPALTYYQLWHDLTHASASVRWLREQVRDVARNLAGHGMLQRARPARGRPRRARGPRPGRPPTPPVHPALRGDLLAATCSTSAAPAWGEVDSAAVRFRPDHWLLIENGRIAGAQAEAPGEGWQRHDHRGRLILPGFIDTHVHSPQLDVIASYGTELLDWLDTYTFPAEARYADPARSPRPARRCSSTRCSPTARPRRSSSRPCTRSRPTRCSARPRRAACASSPARC